MSLCSASRRTARGRLTVLALALPVVACSVVAPGEEVLSSGRCDTSQKLCGDTCVSRRSPSTGCGAETCGGCALPHAAAGCAAGACVVAACELGYGDCNGLAEDGCEAHLLNDALHCGACKAACELKNAVAQCVHGRCAVESCQSGRADCDGDPATLCETDLERDPLSCGACGAQCILPGVAEAGCVSAKCVVVTCSAGRASCNGASEDGCEVDLSQNAKHCGSCGTECSSEELCRGGVCTAKCPGIRAEHGQARLSVAPAGFGVGAGDFTLEAWVALHGEFEGTEIFSMNEDYLVNSVRIESLLEGVKCSVVNPKGTGVGSGSASVQSPPLVVGKWTHLACVRSAGTLSFFADGQLAGSSPVATDLLELSPAAMGVPGGYAGKGLRAAPVTIGPMRFSAVARYAKAFSPGTPWPIDADTVAQFLSSKKLTPGAQIPLVDEANGNNLVTSYGGFTPALAELACP